MDFWERVKQEIRNQNTTQEWVAVHAQIKFPTFSGWINKGRLPRVQDSVRIARALNTSVEYLVTGEDLTGLPPEILKLAQICASIPSEELSDIEVLVMNKAARYRAALGNASAS